MICIGPAGFMAGPLSEEAQEARRPPPQWLLLGAEQDRPPAAPSKARKAQVKRREAGR